MRVYLDYAATTPVDPRVLQAMLPFFTELAGNASSVHVFGQEARSAVDQARAQVADAVGGAVRADTVLVSVMAANNEIGTLQPIAEIGKLTRARKIPFHTDATQLVGAAPVNVDELNVDLLSMSAHKRYGPKGAGALYVRAGTPLAPAQHGGSH